MSSFYAAWGMLATARQQFAVNFNTLFSNLPGNFKSSYLENRAQGDPDLAAFIFFLFTLLFLLAFFAWFVLYRKKLLSKINEMESSQKIVANAINSVAEIERQIISKNLHDDIGIQLNVLKLYLTKASRNLSDTQLLNDLIVESMKLLDESIQSVRDIVKNVSPPTLFKLGYGKGVAELCSHINGSGMLKVELTDNYKNLRLNHVTELQAYRIIQEMLNNIIKHAGASLIRIGIDWHENKVVTIIRHDGEGISEAKAKQLLESSQGTGLKNMQKRIELINASVSYYINDSKEFVIKIEITVYDK